MSRELAQAATVNSSVKSSPLFRQFYTLRLTQNMRVKKGRTQFAYFWVIYNNLLRTARMG